MKTYLIFILCITLNLTGFSKDEKKPVKKKEQKAKSSSKLFYKKAVKHYRNKNYNLSLYFLFSLIKKNNGVSKKENKLLTRLLGQTGTLPLYLYDPELLEQINNPYISLHLANHYFKKKDYKKSMAYASSVPDSNKFYPEARLIIGSTLQLKGDPQFKTYLKQCIKSAHKKSGGAFAKKFKLYYDLIRENCQINYARELYGKDKYARSNAIYTDIPKTAFSWPYLLLEKAWNYYQLKDYNRSLGLLMTYESPLLASYFLPEAEILKALNYYNLCLYNDTAILIEKFFKVYKKRSLNLRSYVKKHKDAEFYFNFIDRKLNSKLDNSYVKSLKNQLKKKLKVNLHYGSYKKTRKEYKRLKAKGASKRDLEFLEFTMKKMRERIGRHVQEYFYYFINQINFVASEMFNIRLEVISRKKDLLYNDKTLVAKRARGGLENVNRDTDEYFFTFQGAFWADELGDYSFGLKSNCKEVDKNNKE